MSKFKIGQIVNLKEAYAILYRFSPDSYFKIQGQRYNVYELIGLNGKQHHHSYNMEVSGGLYRFVEDAIDIFQDCPVCKQKITVDNGKIKEHKHNNELCYGSYTPYEKV